MTTGHCGDDHRRTIAECIVPSEHDHSKCLFQPHSLEDAAAIAVELEVLGPRTTLPPTDEETP